MSFIMAGIAIVGAVVQFMGASDAAKAQIIIAKANAEAGNLTRQADNEFRAAQSALQNFIRAEDTKRKFESAGNEWNVINQNIERINDNYINGNMQQKIASAEEAGSLSAQASFLGIGGSTVDTINHLSEKHYGDTSLEREKNLNYQIGDMLEQRNNLMARASDSTDQGTTFANLDYNKNVAEYVAKPSPFAYLLQGITQAAPYIRVGLGQTQMKNIKNSPQYQGFQNGAQNTVKQNYGRNMYL